MKKKISPSFRKAVIAMAAVAALAGILFGIRAVVNSKKSVGVVSVMSIADTWYDYGSTGYGQISQGGTQQVWADRSMLISKVYVSEGDHVQKGDPLMQYDVTQARLQEDSCRIEYEMAARDLRRAEERLSYIRTFRPNERPEPLRMIFPDPVDITKDEEGRLLIISGKESVEEFIDKDGVYGITININCSTPVTRRTFETLLSYDPRAELPHPDDEVPVIPSGPDDPGQSPAGEDTQDPSGDGSPDPSEGT
ncbi:MAG: biotin/lipoyl-binding protein, partial [Oscillospiraceae bacterium]|nr:biotin/lipoyl-binding protein [Oscillospiraceae bacterium]